MILTTKQNQLKTPYIKEDLLEKYILVLVEDEVLFNEDEEFLIYGFSIDFPTMLGKVKEFVDDGVIQFLFHDDNRSILIVDDDAVDNEYHLYDKFFLFNTKEEVETFLFNELYSKEKLKQPSQNVVELKKNIYWLISLCEENDIEIPKHLLEYSDFLRYLRDKEEAERNIKNLTMMIEQQETELRYNDQKLNDANVYLDVSSYYNKDKENEN